jgi:sulfite reductase (NADPH) flavoprotein alpha-component
MSSHTESSLITASPKDFSSSQPPFVNTQLLAQHVAYLFSDKLFSYSPESFDLDTAVKQWSATQQKNAFGFATGVQSMETRAGAGSIALGYVFSPDFDLSKRHIPQSLIASSGSLASLRESLSQLSLLHELANPFVAHIASADYNGATGLVSDYVSALDIADDLGLGLVSSSSTSDAQHMALLATALATVLPTLHVYDGISSRDVVTAGHTLGEAELQKSYKTILKQLGATESKHSDREGKALRALAALNSALGTNYEPFEYHGHAKADNIFVTFGSAEALLAAQIVEKLVKKNVKVGTVNVRLYRPFIEEEFLRVIPKTAKSVHVYGQVEDQSQVSDKDRHSRLYQDVLAALTIGSVGGKQPSVVDVKYSKHQVISHASVLDVVSEITGKLLVLEDLVSEADTPVQLSIWSLDESVVSTENSSFARIAAHFLESRVHSRISHDNLVQGGVTRGDVTLSAKLATDVIPVLSANIAYVGSEKILKEYDVLASIRTGGTLIVSLAGVKDEDLEKKLSDTVRAAIKAKDIRLQILDVSASPTASETGASEASLVHLAVLRAIEDANLGGSGSRTAAFGSEVPQNIHQLDEELGASIRVVEIPETWVEEEDKEDKTQSVPVEFTQNSFAPYLNVEDESVSRLDDWIIAAKGAVFKEAYGTTSALRPESGVKTSVVTVKEHRRLTPLSYDRNVFHIEFDLGNSGLTYAIGEALGIHAENDSKDVLEFITFYGLNPDEIVQVPSRDDQSILENRTIYQALIQNVDIFGRPPKRFYEALAEFATDDTEQKSLQILSQPQGAVEFKRRSEVDTITFADLLAEFPSARPAFHDLIRIVSPLKRREYSIASSQHVTPTSVALLIVTVGWTDPSGRDRFGLATRYLNSLKVGTPVTVSVKPSVMKLPLKSTAPIIMAGLGTGLAPFRAFVQERAYQKQVLGLEIGSVLLYLGARHQREEYLYGEEWEAYRAAGIVTLIGAAFSRDQPQKIYIQDRMRQTMDEIRQAYLKEEGSFYLCGPTWPVPDVTEVLQEAVEVEAKSQGAKKVDARREIETLKDGGRFVLEVY